MEGKECHEMSRLGASSVFGFRPIRPGVFRVTQKGMVLQQGHKTRDGSGKGD